MFVILFELQCVCIDFKMTTFVISKITSTVFEASKFHIKNPFDHGYNCVDLSSIEFT